MQLVKQTTETAVARLNEPIRPVMLGTMMKLQFSATSTSGVLDSTRISRYTDPCFELSSVFSQLGCSCGSHKTLGGSFPVRTIYHTFLETLPGRDSRKAFPLIFYLRFGATLSFGSACR